MSWSAQLVRSSSASVAQCASPLRAPAVPEFCPAIHPPAWAKETMAAFAGSADEFGALFVYFDCSGLHHPQIARNARMWPGSSGFQLLFHELAVLKCGARFRVLQSCVPVTAASPSALRRHGFSTADLATRCGGPNNFSFAARRVSLYDTTRLTFEERSR